MSIEPPTSEWRTVWIAIRTATQNFAANRGLSFAPKRLLAPQRLPGWAIVLLGLFQKLEGFYDQIRFGFDIAKELGGEWSVIAALIESPAVGTAFIIVGVAWVTFVGEPKKGAVKHPAAIIVGWSVFGICLTTIAVVFGYGLFQWKVQQQAGKREAQIQQESAVRPVYWHLTDAQRIALAIALDNVPEKDRFEIPTKCLADAGSRTYLEDIGSIFLAHQWKVLPGNCAFSDLRPDLTGLYIGLSKDIWPENTDLDQTKIPPNAKKLAELLIAAQIPFHFGRDNKISGQQFFLVIGNAP